MGKDRKPPSSAGVPATEPMSRTRNGLVDSTGASSGPLGHSGGRWPGCRVSPASESSAGCRPGRFKHCRVDSSMASAQASLSPGLGRVSTSAGGAPGPQQRKPSQRNPSHATLRSPTACERQGRAGGQGWVTEAPPHCLGHLRGLQEDLLAGAGASCISPPLFALVPGMECVPGERL